MWCFITTVPAGTTTRPAAWVRGGRNAATIDYSSNKRADGAASQTGAE